MMRGDSGLGALWPEENWEASGGGQEFLGDRL